MTYHNYKILRYGMKGVFFLIILQKEKMITFNY